MKKYALALVVMACMTPSLAVRQEEVVLSAPTPPLSDVVIMQVVALEALNVRARPDHRAPAEYQGLKSGQNVKVYLSCTGGELREWVALDRDCTRWVNAAYLR